MTDLSLSRSLSPESFRTAIEAWIPPGSEVAIVDVPVHRNVGDLFILAATHHLLELLDCHIVYAAGVRDYSAAAARRVVTPATILVGLGGGNFGDLYPRYQALRERVLSDFPRQRLVVLPQTVHFDNAAEADRAAALFAKHRDLRLAVRDEPSLATAHRFTAQTMLLPDIVDAMGSAIVEAHPAEVSPPDVRRLLTSDATLAVRRRDGERRSGPTGAGYDWGRLMPGATRRMATTALAMSVGPARWRPSLHVGWALWARRCLLSAVGVMRQADRIVTDRLHAAIVARLAGRPVVLADNAYGKIGAYYDAWWRDDPRVTLAETAPPSPPAPSASVRR